MGNRFSFAHSRGSGEQSSEKRGVKRKHEDDLDSSGRDTPPPSPDSNQNADILHTPKRYDFLNPVFILDGTVASLFCPMTQLTRPLEGSYITIQECKNTDVMAFQR